MYFLKSFLNPVLLESSYISARKTAVPMLFTSSIITERLVSYLEPAIPNVNASNKPSKANNDPSTGPRFSPANGFFCLVRKPIILAVIINTKSIEQSNQAFTV